MKTSVSIPLDADGYLRRECPNCIRQFKWFSGETDDRPTGTIDPTEYTCPYCGIAAPTSDWWTQEQLDYAVGMAGPAVTQEATSMLKKEIGKINRRSSFIKMEVSSRSAPTPGPMAEPNNMVMKHSPCHGWEPIKVSDDWHAALHCLVCGAQFDHGAQANIAG
ncbi:MAG: hypothetical protein DWP92_04250 [Armatimonadetes bacterium]|nr:MAG: hypothetical protein DWP92_04250 [Armatimonadota bacterium]